jgi:hypothetical protein
VNKLKVLCSWLSKYRLCRHFCTDIYGTVTVRYRESEVIRLEPVRCNGEHVIYTLGSYDGGEVESRVALAQLARKRRSLPKICSGRIYVGAFQYTYNSSSFLFPLTYSSPVSTSHQNVVLEIDFAGALWVNFSPLYRSILPSTFLRVIRIYTSLQMTSPSEPSTSTVVNAVRGTMRSLSSLSNASL